jgi:Anti-sigma-K factor rskA
MGAYGVAEAARSTAHAGRAGHGLGNRARRCELLADNCSVGASADQQRRGGWWAAVWGVAAITCIAVAAFAASFFRGRERDISQELEAAREQLRSQTIELTRLNEAFPILKAPDTALSSFGQGQGKAQPPKGKFFVNPALGVVLLVSNLPPAAAGKIYEMWLLPKRGMPLAAGLFQSSADGTSLYVHRGMVDLAATSAIAVTLENTGGAPAPSLPALIVAALPGPS